METFLILIPAFLAGITIGSFLNVCILRIPRKEEIVWTPSHCMECGHRLGVRDLVPVFSFLALKGKCRYCGAKLSVQYPVIELLNGLFYILVFLVNGTNITSVIYCLCASILLIISVIDWRTYEIPPGLNIAIAVLGAVNLILDRGNWLNYLIGAVSVSGFFLILFLITRGRGIGGGDIKLMAAAGLLLGWQRIILAMAVGCILGAIIHLTLMKIKGEGRVLAFGPYLSAGIFISMLFGEGIIAAYLGLFGL